MKGCLINLKRVQQSPSECKLNYQSYQRNRERDGMIDRVVGVVGLKYQVEKKKEKKKTVSVGYLSL